MVSAHVLAWLGGLGLFAWSMIIWSIFFVHKKINVLVKGNKKERETEMRRRGKGDGERETEKERRRGEGER